MRMIFALTIKSLKMIYRNRAVFATLTCFAGVLFTAFLLIFLQTKGKQVQFLSGEPYSKLHFDYACESSVIGGRSLQCTPRRSSKTLTASELLYEISLGNKSNMTHDDNDQEKVLNLIASLVFNGVPLLDLSDYVRLSDYINTVIGEEGIKRLLSIPIVKEKFGNLLSIRTKEIRITPSNCFTRSFHTFLVNSSQVAKVYFSTNSYAKYSFNRYFV